MTFVESLKTIQESQKAREAATTKFCRATVSVSVSLRTPCLSDSPGVSSLERGPGMYYLSGLYGVRTKQRSRLIFPNSSSVPAFQRHGHGSWAESVTSVRSTKCQMSKVKGRRSGSCNSKYGNLRLKVQVGTLLIIVIT
jgi:hypothetical protein